MANKEQWWLEARSTLEEAEKQRVSIYISRDDVDEPWEVAFEEADVNESLDINKGPICVSYECDTLSIAIGTAWKMFCNAKKA